MNDGFTRSTKGFTLVEIMIVVAIIGILVAVAVPGFIRARSQSRMKSCQENLTKIQGAKEQWALENQQKPGATVTSDQIAPADGMGFIQAWPSCPVGFDYVINTVGEDPTCPSGLPGHSLSEVGDAITDLES